MKATILVVDDEAAVRVSLADILRLEGYRVLVAENGRRAIEILGEEEIDLMLLDIKMPGIDGTEVLKVASKVSPDSEIILLTAHGSLESAVEALRQGAHDYLLKPASTQEILSSVASGIARREEAKRKKMLLGQLENSIQQLKDFEGIEETPQRQMRVVNLPEGVMVDLARRELWRGNVKVALTPTEGKLLQVLLEHRGRVLTHKELVYLVQGYDVAEWEAPEVLRPLVSRLRRKLAHFPNGDKWVVNVRGTGYLFEYED